MTFESEDQLQSECYMWFHSQFPHLRGLLCYNLNNSRNKVRAMMDKGMGLQKGRSDMVFYYQGQAYHIELKLPGNYQEKDQKIWERKIVDSGFEYFVVKSVEEFKSVMTKVIENEKV